MQSNLSIIKPASNVSPSELIPSDDQQRADHDYVMLQVKNATTATDVFNVVEFKGKQLQLPHLVQSMKSLFELQKMGM